MEKTKIWLSSPHMGEAEFKYVKEAFDTNWIAPVGPHLERFESGLSALSNQLPVAAVSAGTAAIHLALILLDVGREDEVICSSFTFAASANPIVYQGASPIFVDSEEESWNMCPLRLEECIKDRIAKGKKPKAVILVHLYGMPAKMKELMAVCQNYDIPLIEDAAEGLGSTYKGQPLGTFGDFGVYSFNGNKIITTSGGGALVSHDESQIEKAKFLATQARDNAPHYEHSHIGYNYRMSNVCAAIGLGQLEVLDERVKQRRANHQFYQEQLQHLSEIVFLSEPEGFYSNRWLTAVLLENVDREVLREALLEENIEARPLWKPMHMQPIYKDAPMYGGAVCERLFEKGLCLPSGSNLSIEDLKRVTEKIIQTIEK
jgi:dTDP-4-amino-4,6-dideoxygalactose transaminase